MGDILFFAVLIPSIYLILFLASLFFKRKREKRAVLTGGGSSGHIYPAIAIGKSLEPEVSDFVYIGAKGRIEEKIVPREKITLKLILAAPYETSLLKFIKFILFTSLSMLKCFYILYIFQPKFIIGSGGFVSAPVVFSGFILNKIKLLKAKIILHEQNVSPGKFNLLASKMADKILVTFKESLSFFGKKGCLIGYPVRKEVQEEVSKTNLSLPSINEEKILIYAFGGSQGSRCINRAVVDSLRYLFPIKEKIYIMLSCGLGYKNYNGFMDVQERLQASYSKEEIEIIKEFFTYKDYYFNAGEILSRANLVIGRSGAGTIFELSLKGIPSILIPKMGLSNEHQVMNAIAVKKANGALILYEKPLEDGVGVDGKELSETIKSLISSKEKLITMGRCAKEVIPHHDIFRLIKEVILEDREINPLKTELKKFNILFCKEKILSLLQNQGIEIDEDEEKYYEALTLNLLYSQNWKEKNFGVKLSFYFKVDRAKEKLIDFATNRKEVSTFKKLFLGDFEEVGFVRRNSLFSLKNYDLNEDELLYLLEICSTDPYYEVRSALLILLREKKDKLKDPKFIEITKKLAKDKEFEVVKEAVALISEIGGKGEVDFLLTFCDNYYWQVRNSALLGLLKLFERGKIEDKERVIKGIDSFILTSTDFKPHFEIKESFSKLKSALRGK